MPQLFSLDVVLLALLILCGIAAATSRNLFGTALILGTYSFILAILWALWGALDVSFTEAVISAGAGTIFFIALLWFTHHQTEPSQRSLSDFLLVLVLLVLAVGGFAAMLSLPDWASASAPAQLHVSPWYLTRSLEDTNTPNVVTSVLADYRGFDTLMETAVIFTAAVSCWLLGEQKQ